MAIKRNHRTLLFSATSRAFAERFTSKDGVTFTIPVMYLRTHSADAIDILLPGDTELQVDSACLNELDGAPFGSGALFESSW